MKTFLKISFYSLIFLLISAVATPSEIFAQNGLRIYDEIGGGSNDTQTPSDNDNTFIYVAGGLLIAGILAYALFIKKDDKPESDTTATLESRLIYSESNSFNSDDKLKQVKEQLPVDFFLGIRNNEALLNDKTYMIGFRLKL